MVKNSFNFKIKYSVDGKKYVANKNDNEHFKLGVCFSENSIKVYIEPKTALKIDDFTAKYHYKFNNSSRIFVNGYQSWTDSLEYSPSEKMSELSSLTEFLITNPPLKNIGFSFSGDLPFWKFPRKNGIFYGWSYGYVRHGSHIDIFGSLSERCGFTAITFDTKKNNIYVQKDLEGVTFEEKTLLLDFAVVSGDYDEAFDKYFDLMGVKCRENKRRTGYTTWYNYYSSINKDVVERDLKSISEFDSNIDIFQIDDGYQSAIGDWLITDEKKFPNGMKYVADKIHSNNMLAGLWLAPFAAVKSSKLYKEHPDWFIKKENGKSLCTGQNWGGFYSLDIYNEGAREYLHKVFDVVLNEWGYDMVKLDFLYGACVLPLHNKTRGQVMCDAMELLRECCGDKLILGCGVPLMPAFGKVDYCRIGADIALEWEHKKHIHREDVSTPHAVCNTIFRRHLDGRAWKNDPDVFLLRDNNIKMNFEQRKLLAKINSTFGSLLFTSDNVGDYNVNQAEVLKETYKEKDIEIARVGFIADKVMRVEFYENSKPVEITFNIENGEIQ